MWNETSAERLARTGSAPQHLILATARNTIEWILEDLEKISNHGIHTTGQLSQAPNSLGCMDFLPHLSSPDMGQTLPARWDLHQTMRQVAPLQVQAPEKKLWLC